MIFPCKPGTENNTGVQGEGETSWLTISDVFCHEISLRVPIFFPEKDSVRVTVVHSICDYILEPHWGSGQSILSTEISHPNIN